MTDSDIDRLWQDAVRKHLANMPPEAIAELLAEIKPDAAPKVETPPVAAHAEQIRAAEEAGDLASAFRLKSQWINRLANPNIEKG